ncbi:hypothetical protein C8R47DRAFT_1206836 [Mycena vitilis]|nr:hypothetical protein C8R47DRAFT_1206836 [Mycena vitilis]
MDASSLTPYLPLELERHIFELCALSRPVGIPRLMLVAWRVKKWVEPILYRCLTVGYTKSMKGYPFLACRPFLDVLRSKPGSFFANAVRHLTLFLPRSDKEDAICYLCTVLSVCTGVENLSLACDSDDFAAYEILEAATPALPLRHLYADPRTLFSVLPSTNALFSRITHLEVTSLSDGIREELPLLLQLTHLAFDDYDFSPCLALLKACQQLRVLVALSAPAQHFPGLAALVQDMRFVTMTRSSFLKDWQMGVHAGIDYWTHAEDFIAQRRSGEIDALQYIIPGDDSRLIE